MPAARASSFSFGAPTWLMPDRSPFTSAQKTGTPISENPCAMICKVTVLPVPVAPAITPCRLARFHSRLSRWGEALMGLSETSLTNPSSTRTWPGTAVSAVPSRMLALANSVAVMARSVPCLLSRAAGFRPMDD